jgi:2-polyprenyl-3-methyl-5-hydroxy-6-metoxy-1,4-benzoquinol methylase
MNSPVGQNSARSLVSADSSGEGKLEVMCPLCGGLDVTDFCAAPDRFHLSRKEFCLVRCRTCACVWLLQPPKPHEMGVYYSEDYHRAISSAGESKAVRRWGRHREKIFKQKRSGSILDIGCSSGSFLSTMSGGAWKLYGIELEPSMAHQARAATGAEVFVGEVTDAEFPNEFFDVITCFDVLEHVYDPRHVLARAFEWLKPGGILYIVAPNINSWESRLFGGYWYGLELPRHLFHFSPRSLRHVAKAVGFVEVNLSTGHSYVERSLEYVSCEVTEAMGFSATPPSIPRKAGLPWRIVRKLMRIALVQPAALVASRAGAGASIEAIFAKMETRTPDVAASPD